MRLFHFLFSFGLLFCHIQVDAVELKAIEPQWVTKVRSDYAEGGIQEVILADRVPTEQNEFVEIAQKFIQYYPSGTLMSETDLANLPLVSADDPIVPHGSSISYDLNGKIESIAHYVDGKKEGLFQWYYPDEKLYRKQSYAKDLPDGPFAYFDEAGQLIEEGKYKNGALHAERVRYYASGQKREAANYVNGLLHGRMTSWYESGAVEQVKFYFHGMLHDKQGKSAITRYFTDLSTESFQHFRFGVPQGYAVRLHPSGKESYKVLYTAGKKDGKECSWSAAGELLGETEFKQGVPVGKHYQRNAKGILLYSAHFDEAGTLLSPIIECDESGVKLKEYYTKNGQLEGAYLEWYPNKAIKYQYHFKDGNFDGEQKSFYPSGKLAVRVMFDQGKRHDMQEEWYETGTKWIAFSYKNGVKEGECRRWNANGKTQFHAFFKQGALHGTETSWFENGQMSSTQSFKDGLASGKLTKWHTDGTCIFEQEYLQGILHGYHQEWYPNGTLKAKVHYINGRKDGLEEEYYASGKPSFRTHYIQGQIDGEYLAWFENGKVHKQYVFSKGKIEGEAREYHPPQSEAKEQLAFIMRYKDGALEGQQVSFFPDGSMKALFVYKGGLLDGKKSLWAVTGQLIFEATYKKGNLDGFFFQTFPDGSEVKQYFKDNRPHGLYQLFYPPQKVFGKVKAKEANYVNGNLHGEVSEYNEAGTKVFSTLFQKGKKEGLSTYYGHDGRTLMTMEFHDGKQNGKVIQYFPNGAIYKESFFKDDLQEDEERTFFDNGANGGINRYLHGKLHGICQQWNTKAILIFEAEYQDGLRHGKFNKYYDDGTPKLMQEYDHDVLISKKAYDPEGMPLRGNVEKQ